MRGGQARSLYALGSESSLRADTRYYWNLTKNILRYNHLSEKDVFNGAHTVNEGELESSFMPLYAKM